MMEANIEFYKNEWMNERTEKNEENETTWMKLWNVKYKTADRMGRKTNISHLFLFKKKKKISINMPTICYAVYNILFSSSFPFNVRYWDIILFTGAICALLLHQSIFSTCTCRYSCSSSCNYILSCTNPCVVYSSELYTMCDVQCAMYNMWCIQRNVSNEKEPIETRIKRTETFIIYALFSVVAIYFFHSYLLLAILSLVHLSIPYQ